MSLFKLTEWYSNSITSASCITGGKLYEAREQLVVGAEDGVLTVLDPCVSEKHEETITAQVQTGNPAIALMIGDFLPATGPLIALLAPHSLTYYKASFDAKDQSRNKVEQVFSHNMSEAAYSMCVIPSTTPQQILVQSIGCRLTLFQGDQCVFSRALLPSLHPGPLVYSLPSASLLGCNGGFLNCVKFSVLASVGNTKKITFDWVFNMGDVALDVTVEAAPPIQPSIVVLCRRNVYCLTVGGVLRWQIRLNTIATCMISYSAKKNDAFVRTCIATATNTLLIYQDTRLMWNCQTDFLPVALHMSNFDETHQRVLSMLSPTGRVCIGYLGTEPNLYKVPPDSRFVDYKAKVDELKTLEASIKDGGNSSKLDESSSKFEIKVVTGPLDKSSLNARGDSPTCVLTISFEGATGVPSIQLNARTSLAIDTNHMTIKSPNETTKCKLAVTAGSSLPTSNTVHLVAHCAISQATAYKSVVLPLSLLFFEASPDRNAKYKLTLETSAPVLGLNEIFRDLHCENPTAIGLQAYAVDSTISVFTANKSNRYRIQTDHPALFHLVTKEMVQRISSAQPNVTISVHPPIDLVAQSLTELTELEKKCRTQQTVIESRAREVRQIQALLLGKTKTTKMESLEYIDLLYGNAYEQLKFSIDTQLETRTRIKLVENEIASLFNLLAEIMKLNKVAPTINGNFLNDTQQSAADRLSWASRVTSSDPARMLAILCQQQQQQQKMLAQINEEEADFEAMERGLIEL